MLDYLELGSSPSEESCVQVGTDDSSIRAQSECKRYMLEIKGMMLPIRSDPQYIDKISFRIKSFPHDFGDYYEVVCSYDDEDGVALDLAMFVEAHTPTHWNENFSYTVEDFDKWKKEKGWV